MIRTAAARVVLCAAMFVLTATAHAQTTKTYRTLEARIHQAKIVVRGAIGEMTRTVQVPRNGMRDGTTWPDGIVEYRLTIEPEEVLKGPSRPVVLTSVTSDYDRRYDQWQQARTSVLWFVHDEAPNERWEYLRLGPAVEAEKTYVTSTPPLFSMDLTVLRDTAEILKRARAFAKWIADPKKMAPLKPVEPGQERDVHVLNVSHSLAERCSPCADANFVVLPLHPALEETARQLISHPERSMASGEKTPQLAYDLRMAGLDALRHFPSDRNRALLRSVLRSHNENERKLAREVLDSWRR